MSPNCKPTNLCVVVLPGCQHSQVGTAFEFEVKSAAQSEMLPNCPYPQALTAFVVDVECMAQYKYGKYLKNGGSDS